jgi:hypothetical protein
MSNSMSNDYFSFMSDKRERKQANRRPPIVVPRTPNRSADTIGFIKEPQIEVIESIATDTIIERIFKRFAKEDG